MKICHWKENKVAYAPDELSRAINVYTDHESIVVEKGVIPDDVDIVHFHNRNIQTDKKQIIQYHSEPKKVNLRFPYDKYVLAQYHATLPEYRRFPRVRNIINFEDDLYNLVDVDTIRIGFSPSITKKCSEWYDKGYTATKAILEELAVEEGVEYDIITGVPLDECIQRKAKCNIIIDECITKSYHRSALEGLALGKITVCSIGDDVAAIMKEVSGAKTIPFVNLKIHELKEGLREIIRLGVEEINRRGIKNREWMEKYWNPRVIVREYISIYENISTCVMIAGDFSPNFDFQGFGKLKKQIDDCNIFIFNFEGALGGDPRGKQGPALEISESDIDLNFDSEIVACLANNHSLDFGKAGLEKTIEALEKKNIHVAGLNENPTVIAGIAIWNMCENEGGQGVFQWLPFELCRQIQSSDACTKIVILHGGCEGLPYPTPLQVDFSRYLVDIGVNLVVWHHSHVPGVYEDYDGKRIYYGLGNFVFNNDFGSRGYIVKYNVKTGYSKIIGHEIKDSVLTECEIDLPEKDWTKEWKNFAQKKYNEKYKGWLKKFINDDSKTDLLNFFQCESHREVIVEGLNSVN